MDITPLIPKGRHILTGYGGGGFKLNNERVEGSIIVFGGQCLPWSVSDAAQITFASLQPVIDTVHVELLLLGTGASIVLIDVALRQALKQKGIAVDVMDTGAACRTYNVLLSEERRVAAALIAV